MNNKELSMYQNSFVNKVIHNDDDTLIFLHYEDLIPVGKLTSKEVLAVYHNDYFSRLTEALSESYETTWSCLGDESFFQLCREYIISHPSKNTDLSSFGDMFSVFLANHPYSEQLPFLSELAKFEESFWKIFHSQSPKTFFDLSTMSPDKLPSTSFEFSKDMYLFKWDYKLYELWKVRKEIFTSEILDSIEEEQSIVLYKENAKVRVQIIDKYQYSILSKLQKGFTVNQSLDGLGDNVTDSVQGIFTFLTQSNIIRNIKSV